MVADDHPPKFLLTKEEDKFFSRLLSKEQQHSRRSCLDTTNNQNGAAAAGESSFRVMYYGGAAGSVPFTWESQPGTPKHTLFSDTYALPPLTPPPSYQVSNTKIDDRIKRGPKSKIFHSIFPRIGSRKTTNLSPTPSSSSSSSTSSLSDNSLSWSRSSSYSLPLTNCRKKCNPRLSSRSAIYFGLEDDEDDEGLQASGSRRGAASPNSILCFGSSTSRNRASGDCRRSGGSLRRAFLSILGHAN